MTSCTCVRWRERIPAPACRPDLEMIQRGRRARSVSDRRRSRLRDNPGERLCLSHHSSPLILCEASSCCLPDRGFQRDGEHGWVMTSFASMNSLRLSSSQAPAGLVTVAGVSVSSGYWKFRRLVADMALTQINSGSRRRRSIPTVADQKFTSPSREARRRFVDPRGCGGVMRGCRLEGQAGLVRKTGLVRKKLERRRDFEP